MSKIFIIAGEVSGDMFAAQLMSDISQKKQVQFVGYGGQHMLKQGLIPLYEDNTLFSAVGILEAGRFLFKQWKMLRSIVPYIKKHHIKNIVLVDHEVFNILAAKKIRKAFGSSVKIFFFIPPRVSMWGKKNAPVLAGLCDALFCYMYPDVAIYKQYTDKAFYFGNPLSAKLKNFIPNKQFYQKHSLNPHMQYAALMPGSRLQEIESLLPVFLRAAKRFYNQHTVEFLMAIAHQGLRERIEKELKKQNFKHAVHILDDSSLEVMAHCKYGLVSAGTITLETVMTGMYPIIAYKVSPITFWMIKKSERLPDSTLVGLPNVFLQQRIFPELLQFEVNEENLCRELDFIHNMEPTMREYIMMDAQERLSDALGSTHSIEKVADYIIEHMQDAGSV